MKTLEKAFDVMELFLESKDKLTLSQVAEISGINISTAHRLCSTMAKRGYLYQAYKNGPYTLGLNWIDFGAVTRLTSLIKEKAFPSMRALQTETEGNIVLHIPSESESTEICIVRSKTRLPFLAIEQERLPLYASANGKVFLAYRSMAKVDRYLSQTTLEPHTDYTIVSPKKLKENLTEIKKEGLAFDIEEREYGLSCIAAPIFSGGKVIASIGLVLPSKRMTAERLPELVTAVKRSCKEVSDELDGVRINNS